MRRRPIDSFPFEHVRAAACLGNRDALRDHHNAPSPRKVSTWRAELPLPPGMSQPPPAPEEPILHVPSVRKTQEQLLVALGRLPEELTNGPGLDFLYGFYAAGFWLFPDSMNVDYDLEVLKRAVALGCRHAQDSESEWRSESVWAEMLPWISPVLNDRYDFGGQDHVYLAYRTGRWWAGVCGA